MNFLDNFEHFLPPKLFSIGRFVFSLKGLEKLHCFCYTLKGPLLQQRIVLKQTLVFQKLFDQKTRLACTGGGGLGAPLIPF